MTFIVRMGGPFSDWFAGVEAAVARKGLMRSLGEFVGHIGRAIRTDPAREKTELRRESQVEERQGPDGKVILRRTTIEEMEVRKERP